MQHPNAIRSIRTIDSAIPADFRQNDWEQKKNGEHEIDRDRINSSHIALLAEPTRSASLELLRRSFFTETKKNLKETNDVNFVLFARARIPTGLLLNKHSEKLFRRDRAYLGGLAEIAWRRKRQRMKEGKQ